MGGSCHSPAHKYSGSSLSIPSIHSLYPSRPCSPPLGGPPGLLSCHASPVSPSSTLTTQGLLATFLHGWIQDPALSGCWTDGTLSLSLSAWHGASSEPPEESRKGGWGQRTGATIFQGPPGSVISSAFRSCIKTLQEPALSIPTPGAPSPPRIYSVLQAHRRGKYPLEPERPKGSLCVYFHLGWLRSGHHRPESGVGKFRETPGGDACVSAPQAPLYLSVTCSSLWRG